MIDHVVHRVLGAIRFVEAAPSFVGDGATQVVVDEPVHLVAAGLTFRRNRRNYYVIYRSTDSQLRLHHDQFEAPPAEPPVAHVKIPLLVEPASRTYLPRAATLALPRNPDPAAANSLFQPIDIRLYPSPTARLFSGWGSLRATVRDAAGEPVAGALVRVVEAAAPANLMGQGITDWRGRIRGEVLIPIADIPALAVAPNGNGPVVSQRIAIAVQAFQDTTFDPAMSVPDPDVLEADRATLTASAAITLEIAAGQAVTLTLSIP